MEPEPALVAGAFLKHPKRAQDLPDTSIYNNKINRLLGRIQCWRHSVANVEILSKRLFESYVLKESDW